MLERGNFGRHFSPSTIGPGLKCSEVVLPLILPTWSCKGVCPCPLPAAHGSCSGLQCHVLQLPQRGGWKLPLASQGSLSLWGGGCLALRKAWVWQGVLLPHPPHRLSSLLPLIDSPFSIIFLVSLLY